MNQDIRAQVDFYNQRWQKFKFANAYKLTRCAAILEAMQIANLAVPRILDLGCGAGWLSAILGTFGPTVGVDLSEDAMISAQGRYPHVHYIAANIFEWQVPKESFDLVVSQEVIEHVEDQAGYLHVAWEALRTNGYLILTTPNKTTMLAMPDEQRAAWSTQPIENWLTIRDVKKLVCENFTILQICTVIPGLGSKGLHRFFNSTRIENLVEKIGVMRVYDRLRLAVGLGLHVVLLARKHG